MSNPNWPSSTPSPLAVPPGSSIGGPMSGAAPAGRRGPRHLDGLLVGTAAAALGGLAWWAVVAFTEREPGPTPDGGSSAVPWLEARYDFVLQPVG